MWIVIIVVVVVAIGGYLGRHKLKSMLGIDSSPQTSQTSQNAQAAPTSANSAAVPTDNIYKIGTDATKGKYLTDFQGMTLYIFDKDTPGMSNCYEQCAANWPVYTSGATAEKILPANISFVIRKDGTKQFAWKGMPLYYFAKDQKPGEVTGDGVGGVWHIVKP